MRMNIRYACIVGLCIALTGCASTAANGNAQYYEQVDAAPSNNNQDTTADRYGDNTAAAAASAQQTPVSNETMGGTADMDASDGVTGGGQSYQDGGASYQDSSYQVGGQTPGSTQAQYQVADTGDVTSSDSSVSEVTEAVTTVPAVTSPPTQAADVTSTVPTSETTAASSATSASEEAVAPSETAETEETLVSRYDPIAELTNITVTAQQTEDEDIGKYDPEFFKKDLFIGDSISTGLSLYNFLPAKNVFAKMGLNPSTVLTKQIETSYGTIGVSDMIASVKPKRVYIMLGSNGIQWLSDQDMITSMGKLTKLIKDGAPDASIIIISTPPVAYDYSFQGTMSANDIMERIDSYNNSLRGFCLANGYVYSDVHSKLLDSTGYFNSNYAEKDGLHFKGTAYQIMLHQVQTDTAQAEKIAAERAETDTGETDDTAETAVPGQEDSPVKPFADLAQNLYSAAVENARSDSSDTASSESAP